MFKDWNFWLTVLSLIIALLALFQTHRQVKLSNKQQLFQQRLETYNIVDGLLILFEKYYSLFEKEEKYVFINAEFKFVSMTNNSYLYSISPAISNPLNNPEHVVLLNKLEEIKQLSKQIKFIFPSKEAKTLSDFVWNYQKLLFVLYQYQIMKKNKIEVSKTYLQPIETVCNDTQENELRNEVYEKYSQLKSSYEEIRYNKITEKIEKLIKLN